MKLYFSPGACSLAPHIALREVGAKFDLEQVDNKAKKTKSGADFWQISPKGYVPVLELDNGERSPRTLPSCNISATSFPRQAWCRWSAPSTATGCRNG